MRNLELKMLEAIKVKKSVKVSPNTYIKYLESKDVSEVYLHGNKIATVSDDYLEVCTETLCKYPTHTTKSRLNTLLTLTRGYNKVFTKNYNLCLILRGVDTLVTRELEIALPR